MLESRLILNVTVLAPEPHNHVANRHAMRAWVIGPEHVTLPPGSAQGWAGLAVVLWSKRNSAKIAL